MTVENRNDVTVVQCTGQGMARRLNFGERRRPSRGCWSIDNGKSG